MSEVNQSLHTRFTSWWQSYEVINKGKMQIAQDAYSQGSSDFDAQRLRADTAEAELRTEKLRADAAVGDANEAERKLAASEQRIAVLKSALEGMLEYFPEGHSDGECFSVEAARAALNQKSEGEIHVD